jgi:hypothetical protein
MLYRFLIVWGIINAICAIKEAFRYYNTYTYLKASEFIKNRMTEGSYMILWFDFIFVFLPIFITIGYYIATGEISWWCELL